MCWLIFQSHLREALKEEDLEKFKDSTIVKLRVLSQLLATSGEFY